MNEGKENKMPTWALPAFSWLVSFYFLSGFAANVGFPPDRNVLSGDLLQVALWLFFLFLPFIRRIKIGGIIELERELQQTKQELQDFKTEIRNSVSVLSTNVNTIGSMTNQVNINVPSIAELQEAGKTASSTASPKVTLDAREIKSELLSESEDTPIALARTRMEMERLLRELLGKRTSVNALRDNSIKYFGLRQLFEMFIRENDQYSYLREPFSYVNQVCNAAIHAQKVSEPQAQEALGLGAQIIAALREAKES